VLHLLSGTFVFGAAGSYREVRRRLRPVREVFRQASSALLRERARRRFSAGDVRRSHGLSAPLIVSLTSYPPRFPTLRPTLECLLTQSIKPDRTVLWVADSDLHALPSEVVELERRGLDIETCADMGPFKKLVPALIRWPDAFICTADDDVYYHRTWLAEFVSHLAPSARVIPCHVARGVAVDGQGAPLPYRRWRHEASSRPHPLVFPIGLGGVLYPPASLSPEATNAALFTALCPTSDDVWVYWMARRNGWTFHRISNRQFVCWTGSQQVALQHDNLAFGNDLQIARLTATFGFPPFPERFHPHDARPAEVLHG
jgi:hypothetical protein